MAKMSVIKSGGKQYLVKENDEIVVDRIAGKEKDPIELETLLSFDSESAAIELGEPALKKNAKAEIVAQGQGDKIRVARFKSKVRYRKVTGFRADLTKLKIVSL